MTKVLFLAGSARKDSLNKKLAKQAAEMAGEIGGAEITFIDLKDFPMPIYDGDLEADSGLPENAIKLKQLFIEHDGFFIASPEYNSSISALLKNSLDWISRPHEKNETPLVAFSGKVAAISAASPGGFGGLRGLVPLRMVLGNIGVVVLPAQLAIANANDVFDADGKLTSDYHIKTLTDVVGKLIKTTSLVSA